MANFLARWTMDWVPTAAPRAVPREEAGGPEVPPGEPVPIFTNPKALTFPIIVGLVKGAWEALKALQQPWISYPWIPFGLCLALGLAITVANLIEENPKPIGWVLGVCVGLLNSC